MTTPTNTRSQGGAESDDKALIARLQSRLEREASRRNSAYDYFGMDNTPQSVDADMFALLERFTALAAPASAQEAPADEDSIPVMQIVAALREAGLMLLKTERGYRVEKAVKFVAQTAPSAAVQQGEALTAPSDGDYLRQARHGGASVVWQGEGAGVHFSTAAWAAFCNSLRTTDRAALASAQPKTGEDSTR